MHVKVFLKTIPICTGVRNYNNAFYTSISQTELTHHCVKLNGWGRNIKVLLSSLTHTPGYLYERLKGQCVNPQECVHAHHKNTCLFHEVHFKRIFEEFPGLFC
jgi:hypothetical protein